MFTFLAALLGLVGLSAAGRSSSSASPGTSTGTSSGASGASSSGGDSKDLIISLMAIRDLSWWPGAKPRLINWVPPAGASGHPSWEAPVNQLRDSSGAFLPKFLKQFRMEDAERIALVGFSAGSNSGLRACLQNASDRRRLDFVAGFDGIHVGLANKAAWKDSEPLSHFIQRDQIDGYLALMANAIAGSQGMVLTASQVEPAQPSNPAYARISATGQAMSWLLQAAAKDAGRWRGGDDFSAGNDVAMPDYLRQRLTELGMLRHQELGQLVMAWFSGNDKAAHILQADTIAPALLQQYLVPRWSSRPSA